MTHLTRHQLMQARPRVARYEALRDRHARLTERIQVLSVMADAAALARAKATEFATYPDALADAIALKRRTDADTATMVVSNYHALLRDMHDKPRDLGGIHFEKVRLDLSALAPAARPYLLGPMFDLSIGSAYVRLDLDRSHPPRVLRYVSTAGPFDHARIQALLPAIAEWLGFPYELTAASVSTIELTQRAPLPAVIPFRPALLKRGHVYYGVDVATRQPVYVPLPAMTHTLAAGQTGSGKSVFLNQVLLSLLFNIDQLHGLTLVDLKGGVELSPFAIHPKIKVISTYDALPDTVSALVTLMDARLAELRATGRRALTTNLHFLIIDEFSAIQFRTFETKEAKERHKRLLADLNLLAAQARAPGIRLWAQLQKPTADAMDTAFRANLASIVAFSLLNANASILFDGLDGLPARPADLPKGRFILRVDGQPDRLVQGAFVPDHFPLASVLASPATPRSRT